MQGDTPRGSKSMKLVYLQCYFVTIATILGTGILGLPVTLTRSGLYPFLVSFILGAFVQALLVCFFTDLLQRAHAKQVQSHKEDVHPLNDEADLLMDEDCDELDAELESNGPVLAGHVIIPKDITVQPPNLHLLGSLFLGCGVRQCFDIILVLQFIALLISYSLAGSEAYAEVIGIDYRYVIPVFVWVLTLAIVFALRFIQPVVSVLTFFKGSLLLGTVIVTFYVGAEVNRDVSNNFSYFGAPFLMGTVALGGVVNVMPLMYSKISPVKDQISKFRLSIVLGLMTCAILNILWCWAVLDIVPQLQHYQCNHTVCEYEDSLEKAASDGEISTIPLTNIIHQDYPTFKWVALLVELFIMISITVSYLTIGAVLHHTLIGWVKSVWSKDSMATYRDKLKKHKKCSCCSAQCVCNTILSLLAFSVVFAIAMLDPQGFLDMLEKFASLVINLEVALFIFLMFLKSRNKENIKLKIPLPLSRWQYYLVYIIPLYFGFACGYDLYSTVRDIVLQQMTVSPGKVITEGILSGTHKNITNTTTTTTTVAVKTLISLATTAVPDLLNVSQTTPGT